MFINVILALIPAVMLFFINQSSTEELNRFKWLFVFELVWYLPFPTYLFFEIKHLLINDGIANELDKLSLFVFGGQSLLGLILQIFVLVSTVNLEIFGNLNLNLIIFLSFLASFGGCLGLTDLPLLFIVFPHKVFQHSLIVLKNWRLVLVCISTTALLSFLTSLFVSI